MRQGTARCVLILLFIALGASASATRAQDAAAPREPLGARIRKATEKAAKALAAAWPSASKEHGEARTLVALALARAGGDAEREYAAKLLDAWWTEGKYGGEGSTYVTALGVSALEGLSLDRVEDDSTTLTTYAEQPMPDEARKRLAVLARALVMGARRGAGGGAAWGYPCAGLGQAVAATDSHAFGLGAYGSWDNSNTQFAALALHDAARREIAIPTSLVPALAAHFLDPQVAVAQPDTGTVRWRYKASEHIEGFEDPPTTVAMTFGALSSLAVARELGCKDARVDDTVKLGLRGLGHEVEGLGPASGENGWGRAYLLYSIEKGLDLLEIRDLDGKPWFEPIAERILSAQAANGLWAGSDVIDSSLYVLFLVRASIPKTRLVAGRTVARAGDTAVSDALARVKTFAEATPAGIAKARTAVDESLRALAREGRGREVFLVGALGEIAASRSQPKRDAAETWLRGLCGHVPAKDEIKAAARALEELFPGHDAASLRAALAPTSLLAVRTYAATWLTSHPSRELSLDLVAGTRALSDDLAVETPPGERCARAHAAALAKVVARELPAIGTPLDPSAVRWLAKVAGEAVAQESAESVARSR